MYGRGPYIGKEIDSLPDDLSVDRPLCSATTVRVRIERVYERHQVLTYIVSFCTSCGAELERSVPRFRHSLISRVKDRHS